MNRGGGGGWLVIEHRYIGEQLDTVEAGWDHTVEKALNRLHDRVGS